MFRTYYALAEVGLVNYHRRDRTCWEPPGQEQAKGLIRKRNRGKVANLYPGEGGVAAQGLRRSAHRRRMRRVEVNDEGALIATNLLI